MNTIPPDEDKIKIKKEEHEVPSEDLIWAVLRENNTPPQKKGSLPGLLKKTLISSVLLTLCSFCLTFVLPEETRGAGTIFFRSLITELRSTKEEPLKAAFAEGEVAAKLAEAMARSPFTLKFPTYLPFQAELSEVAIFDDYSYGLKCVYSGTDDVFIIFIQRDVRESVISVAPDNHIESILKEVYVYSSRGFISSDNDGTLFLSFVDELGIHFTISGRVNQDEMMKIAYSLQ